VIVTITPTEEQRTAIEDELVSQAIIACAGSGKTTSAVRRVIEIRRKMKQRKGYVALLSYSNVAVDTFRAAYERLAIGYPGLSDRVVIATVDSFVATNILLPHGQRSMGCTGRPFLVHGGEPWLEGFKFHNGSYPISVSRLAVSLEGNEFAYSDGSFYGAPKSIADYVATPTIEKLGKKGAYTHALARYWALRTLMEQERLVKVLACRYPFIVIDEAQDVGSVHGAFVAVLEEAGVTVSLVGDPHQAIYEFADADGSFLRSFSSTATATRPLTENRRSVSQIVEVANALSSTKSKAIRQAPTRKHGAYFLKYKSGELQKLVDTFKAILSGHDYTEEEAAVLCRGSAMVGEIQGGSAQTGSGATERLAQAAIYRDLRGDMAYAFECAVDGVLRLIEDPPDRLHSEILGGNPPATAKAIRRLIWQFLKQNDTGLPESGLRAKGEWHPRLKQRLPSLFEKLESVCKMKRSATWGNKLSTRDLCDGPLLQRDLVSDGTVGVRIKTVHKVKGEGIDAVLYVAKKSDLDRLLAGTSTEDGRIGYVAITRAKDLLILAIPSNASEHQVKNLKSIGVMQWT
jgi:superfamily I DNA/RNA helicase